MAGVSVAFDHNPGRRVGYTEVENFARGDEVVEGLHYFVDACMHVPPVDVELKTMISFVALENDKGAIEGFRDGIKSM